MKPVKLNKIPKDPCIGCIVAPACTKTCRPKIDYADYIKSLYHGNHLNCSRDRRRKNAKALVKLYEDNKKYTHFAIHMAQFD